MGYLKILDSLQDKTRVAIFFLPSYVVNHKEYGLIHKENNQDAAPQHLPAIQKGVFCVTQYRGDRNRCIALIQIL